MLRSMISLLSGGLFGTGLMLSGMTDTTKVQGWLDVLGAWDPTLAFVLGGALLPMAIAWRLTRDRSPLAGGHFPAPAASTPDKALIVGSMIFGVGWALAGLCPGPALASLSFGGWQGALFFAAMISGMWLAPRLRLVLDRGPAKA